MNKFYLRNIANFCKQNINIQGEYKKIFCIKIKCSLN